MFRVTEMFHPGIIPETEDAALDWLRLIRSRRVGPSTFIRLLREHGDVAAALAALPGIAAKAGVSGYRCVSRAEAEAEWQEARAAGARPLFLGAPDYPPLLALLPDPPPFLWAIGSPAVAARSPIAIVGARNASGLGRRMARGLAADLGGAGHAIASGLARGIDAAAHEAALETGTVAVLAGGIDVIYPPENAGLAAAIAERGLILSEMPMATPPKASLFLRRNRLVSGLSLGVVVIEAAERSGAINTARAALDQGREVMAVPGSPLDPRAGGCNALLREGATLVRSAADVLEALDVPARPQPPIPPAEPEEPPAEDADLPLRLLALLGAAPLSEDSLIRETGAGAAAVAAVLLDLEMAGRIERHPGGLVSRPAS
ncbi:MAG TPA: DNA-processing protein DprA [Paracoccaceae bacterium]|nr:DNA-processing protein DprA [Paracoccaceae bacterium]